MSDANEPASAGPDAVVMGLSPTGLYAVRELSWAGITVVGIATERQAGCASRYLSSVHIHDDEQARLNWLLHRAKRGEEKSVLIPTSDQDIDFIIRHHARLSTNYAFQHSYVDGASCLLLTKAEFYRWCEDQQIPYPRLHEANRDDLAQLKDRVRFPCMIKPSRIHEARSVISNRKGWIVDSESQWHMVVSTIPAGVGRLLVQEIVPGPESEITLYAAYVGSDGRFHAPFTGRKLRQYPPGFGSASLVVSCRDEDTRVQAENILSRLAYRGIAAVEFKRDHRDGLLKVIEINSRPSLWFAISTTAGARITLAAYRDLAGQRQPLATQQTHGVIWRYRLKDDYSAVFYRLQKDFVLPPPDTSRAKMSCAHVSAVFDMRDPLPALADCTNLVRKSLRQVWRKLVGLISRPVVPR